MYVSILNDNDEEVFVNTSEVLYYQLELSPNKKEHYVAFYFSEKHCVKTKSYAVEDETPKNLIFDYSKILRVAS